VSYKDLAPTEPSFNPASARHLPDYAIMSRSFGADSVRRPINHPLPPTGPKNDTISCSEWTIFRTAREQLAGVSQEKHLARNMLYLKRVLIMKYAQFHALYDALKERVGSVKKLRTR
jgi:hypothetical protein